MPTSDSLLEDLSYSKNPQTDSKKVIETLEWMQSHVLDLGSSEAGSSQIGCIRNNLLPTLEQYRENVVQSQRQRSPPQTWLNRDVVFLPCVYVITMYHFSLVPFIINFLFSL